VLEHICSEHDLELIAIVLLVALLVTSLGKGLGGLLALVVRKLMGYERVDIHLNGPKKAAPLISEPEKQCLAYKSEHERSMRHEGSITELYGMISDQTNQVIKGISRLHKNQLRLSTALVESGVLKVHFMPTDLEEE
jgi:hypothetical protein